MKKQWTKLWSLVLAVCMSLTLVTVPAGAASVTTFSDVSSGETAAEIECLRLLGVLDGYSNGTFQPEGSLTRAQFCKMAVYAMNGSSSLGLYRAVTVFPDVRPSHWAAAYINMASKGKHIIYGYPDGKFYPNRTVTYGQAVTILMRQLGYTDADVGAVWPEGYLVAAEQCGLTSGLTLAGGDVLTRGQAARLFANLLATKVKDGGTYGSTISASQVSTVLVSSDATAADGSGGAMKTSDGTVYKMAYRQGNGLLNGRKGTLLLDKNNQVLTFVPDIAGSSTTMVLASAKADSMTDNAGRKYTMSSAVQMFYEGTSTTYGTVYTQLAPGMTLTLYFGSSGSVEYVFSGGVTSATAVIVAANGSTTGFAELTGSVGSYTIYKDGVKATTADLRKYDVATYDSAANTVRVSSTRLTGFYENCTPNATAPTKVTVMGHEFNVLPSAVESLSKFKPGNQMTLLLTVDNQVAGAVEAAATGGAAGNAVGMVTSLSGTSVTVQLLNGITVKGTMAREDSTLNGQLVMVASASGGKLYLSRLSGNASASLDVANRKLGSASLAENAVIYEKVGTSALTAISLGDITASTVPASRIAYVGTNWAGQVKLLVLNDVTGNCYTYGRANYTPAGSDTGSGYTQATLSVAYGNGLVTKTYSTAYAATNGAYVGIAASADESGLAGLVTLTELTKVSNAAWSGSSVVNVGGKTYAVAANVPCYNRTTGSWMTLSEAKGYSNVLNLYADSHSVVRVIEVP